MSKVVVNESSLTAIGNAIRAKNGETTTYKPSEMAAAITSLPSGGSGGSWSTATITSPTTGYNKSFDISNYVATDDKNWILFLTATYNSSSSWNTAIIAPFLNELDGRDSYAISYTERRGSVSSSGITSIMAYGNAYTGDADSTYVSYANGVISWAGTSSYQVGTSAVLLYQG